MESHNLVVLILLLAAVGFVAVQSGAVAFTETPEEQYHTDHDVLLVEKDDEAALWPYTASDRSFGTKTLAINVVIHGETDDVRTALLTQTDAEWNETADEWEDLDPAADSIEAERNGTSIEWESARGATRYTYVAYPPEHDQEREGYWIASSTQFHDGDYLGTRNHLRLYEPIDPDQGWVAIQAHQEHWDWFGLRHSVDSNEQARQYVEEEFMGQWFVRDVSREYYGTTDALDTDGWVTEIELYPAEEPPLEERDSDSESDETSSSMHVPTAVALSGLLGLLWFPVGDGTIPSIGHASRTISRTRERIEHVTETADLRYLVLFGATLSVLLFVRAAGIGLERTFDGTSPKLIVLLCYPLVPLGVPLCAYVPAQRLDELQSFVVAASGIALGIMLDYALLGVAVLPVEVLVHRLGVVLAVGMIAAGAAETFSAEDAWNTTLRIGTLLWVGVVVAPLVQWF